MAGKAFDGDMLDAPIERGSGVAQRANVTGRARRRTALVILALVGCLSLAGCVSIKSQTASQRAAGVVTLHAVVCASKYAGPSDCDDDGAAPVEEKDTIRQDPTTLTGRLLIGFRVPAGSAGPASFQSDDGGVVFVANDAYASELQRVQPAPADQHWVGYSSNVLTATSPRSVGFGAEFTVPPTADGTPFAGPYQWRMVVGGTNAGDPVNCDAPLATTLCIDSPIPERIAVNLPAPVSDFSVLPAATVNATTGTTATVPFKVGSSDGGGLGAPTVAVSATTTVQGGVARPSAASLALTPNATKSVNVSVPVPAGTIPGSYPVTLSATTGAPPVQRSSSATIVVRAAFPGVRVVTTKAGLSTRDRIEVVGLCPSGIVGGCTGSATLSARIKGKKSTQLGRAASFKASPEQTFRMVFKPAAALRRAIRKRSRVPATVTFDARDGQSPPVVKRTTASVRIVAERFPRVGSIITGLFAFRPNATKTLVTGMTVDRVPRGGAVTLTCRGITCPFRRAGARFPKGARRASFTKRFRKRLLGRGVVIEVRITAPRQIGIVRRFTVQAPRKLPRTTILCVRPGEAPAIC